MSIDTYVYAIVGVHCKDVLLSKETTKVRGCDHPNADSEFCAVCGKKMWIETTIEVHASDKLDHLQEWHGDEETGEFDESAISMIYSQMCAPTEFVVGRVLGEHDAEYEDKATPFTPLTDEEYTAAYEQTKSALEPLGLWDAEKFGYMLYAISM